MHDLLLLALTAALTWALWRAIECYEADVGRWLWAWGMRIWQILSEG
jgi:hypothetical protein